MVLIFQLIAIWEQKMLVADIGVGARPWILQPKKFRSTLYKKFRRIEPGMKYFGIDDITHSTPELPSKLAENLRRRKRLINGSFEFLRADARNLPFKSNSLDIAILSDVLSHPNYTWCACSYDCNCDCKNCDCMGDGICKSQETCCGQIFLGISDEEKNEIVNESVRVLRPNGQLIICVYQTIENAFPALHKIVARVDLQFQHREKNIYRRWSSMGCLETGPDGPWEGYYEWILTKN